MDWADKIRCIEVEMGIENERGRLASLLGIRPGIISDIKKGNSKNPGSNITLLLINKLGVNPKWLDGENQPIFINQKRLEIQPNTEKPFFTDRLEIQPNSPDQKDAITEKPINWLIDGKARYVASPNAPYSPSSGVAPNSPLLKNLRELIEETIEPKLEKLWKLESRVQALENRLEKSNVTKGDFTAEAEPEYDEEEDERSIDTVPITYVGDIAAGPPTAMVNEGQVIPISRRLLGKDGRYYVADINGWSMIEAGIRDGDMVLIHCADVPIDGAIMVVSYQGKSTLKRLRQTKDGGWELHYENGSGKVMPVDSDEYQVQGEFEKVLPDSMKRRYSYNSGS